MTSMSQGVTALSTGAIIGVSIMNFSSLAAIWSIVNQLQLFLLLLLTKTPFPDDVKAMILGNEFMQLDMSFLPINKIPKVDEFLEWVSSDQTNVYLKSVGMESETSLKNNINFGFTLLLLISLYPVVSKLTHL